MPFFYIYQLLALLASDRRTNYVHRLRAAQQKKEDFQGGYEPVQIIRADGYNQLQIEIIERYS